MAINDSARNRPTNRRFDATDIPRGRIGAARDAYNTMVSGRPTASGITDAGGSVDPFDKQHDGSYALNPWTHASNMDPYRGNVAITDFNGETKSVPFWQADRTFSANLGLLGFNDITAKLEELTGAFSESLANQTELGYRNLAEQTGTDYVGLKHGKNDRKQRWG